MQTKIDDETFVGTVLSYVESFW